MFSPLTQADLKFIHFLQMTDVSPEEMFGGDPDGVHKASLDEIASELRIRQSWLDTSEPYRKLSKTHRASGGKSIEGPWELPGAESDQDAIDRVYGSSDGPDDDFHPSIIEAYGPKPRTPGQIKEFRKRDYLQERKSFLQIDRLVAKIEKMLGVPAGTFPYEGSAM